MKKEFLAIIFAACILGCNNHSDHNSGNTDTVQHANHNAGTKPGGNAIKQTMDNMMQGMHKISPTDNNDIDFMRMMVMHHQGAIEMSKIEISQGTDSSLKTFAQTVINDQNKEIGLMEKLIKSLSKMPSANAADFQKAMNGSMMAMMKETALFNNVDKDFVAQMIPHHQSAVDMAKAYLTNGKTNELVTLCNNIIGSQTKEIEWLTGWLGKH